MYFWSPSYRNWKETIFKIVYMELSMNPYIPVCVLLLSLNPLSSAPDPNPFALASRLMGHWI